MLRERDDQMWSASVDPPELAAGAWSDRAPEAQRQDGGSGFTLEKVDEPAWEIVTGKATSQEEPLGDLRHLQHLLEKHPEAMGPMQLQTLNQLRAALCQVSLDDDATTPVQLPAWVVALAARKLARALS